MFTKEDDDEHKENNNNDSDSEAAACENMTVMCATSGVANVGLDSPKIRCVARTEFPPSVLDVVQELFCHAAAVRAARSSSISTVERVL